MNFFFIFSSDFCWPSEGDADGTSSVPSSLFLHQGADVEEGLHELIRSTGQTVGPTRALRARAEGRELLLSHLGHSWALHH